MLNYYWPNFSTYMKLRCVALLCVLFSTKLFRNAYGMDFIGYGTLPQVPLR